MTLSQLDVRVSDGPLHLLNAHNGAFLEGSGEPALGGSSPLTTWVGRAMMGVFGVLWIGLLAVTAGQVSGVVPGEVEWFTFAGVSLFLGGLIYAGRVIVRDSQRLQRLSAKSTHVLPGTIVLEIPGPKGSRTYVYEFETPAGRLRRGQVPVGATVVFPVPSPVAVLFADDRTHTVL